MRINVSAIPDNPLSRWLGAISTYTWAAGTLIVLVLGVVGRLAELPAISALALISVAVFVILLAISDWSRRRNPSVVSHVGVATPAPLVVPPPAPARQPDTGWLDLKNQLRLGRELKAKIETEDYYAHEPTIDAWAQKTADRLPKIAGKGEIAQFMEAGESDLNGRGRLSKRVDVLEAIVDQSTPDAPTTAGLTDGEHALRGKMQQQLAEGQKIKNTLGPFKTIAGGSFMGNPDTAYDVWVSKTSALLETYSAASARRFVHAAPSPVQIMLGGHTVVGKRGAECAVKCAVLEGIIRDMPNQLGHET